MTPFRTPAVRHLAWMCHAPQLVETKLVFEPAAYLTPEAQARLLQWDAQPQSGPAVLAAPPNPRLGLYFEHLYECLLTDILGWQVLARNLQIRSAGVTLGELDFVVLNPHTNVVEHHEIAVKFYLGYQGPLSDAVRWHGPNAIDRLDLKTLRMLEQQSQRTQLVETIAALEDLGITAPLTSRIFMPGYLFYPFDKALSAPAHVPTNHLRGHWATLEEVSHMDTVHWVHLCKPHWLGPWLQSDVPDPVATAMTLDYIEQTRTPRLFACLQQDGRTGAWQEVDRVFVVPAHWPTTSG